jgi:adenylyltransferase/sulfurtransferase
MPEVGVDGQRKLKAGKVLCIGAGGLGSPAAMYLAAAGVGTIGIVDFDAVDVTNLQRQIVHDTTSVGQSKVDSARARIAALNPDVRVATFNARFSAANASALLDGVDVVVDGTDNFPARYLVNDACVLYGKPNVWGSIFRFEGQAAVFAARGGPCYRCLHPEPPPPDLIPNCAEAGKLLIVDALKMRFRELKLAKDPDCPICGVRPAITELRESGAFCQLASHMSVSELKARIDAGTAPVILDVREPQEAAICRIAGSRLIPLGELPRRLDELDRSSHIVVHCKSGGRSAAAVRMLEDAGFAHAANLSGGILQWINEIDPALQRY